MRMATCCASFDKAYSFGRNTVMLGGRASLSSDETGALQTLSTLGGLTFLSGLSERELIGTQMVFLRGIYLSTPHSSKPAVRYARVPGGQSGGRQRLARRT